MKLVPATAAALALGAIAAAGCGTGAGEETGEVELSVTRDYGTTDLAQSEVSIRESDSVLDVLDGETDVETRYGGGFVQSIDGVEAATVDGRERDWFFYVNGVEAGIGSADYKPEDGDRIWWDYRDWSSAMRIPAVVGDWPEPFTGDYADEEWSVGVFCAAGESNGPCAAVEGALADAGVDTTSEANAPEGGDGEIRVLVGTWDRIADDAVASLLRGGPQRSGVFATIAGESPSVGIALLDARGRVRETLGQGAGLVAALRPGEEPPTWVVTGTDPSGLEAAIDLLRVRGGDQLAGRYAVATVSNGPEFEVPVP